MGLNPVDALAEGVQKGLDSFAIGLGDDMLNMSSSMSTVNASKSGQLLLDVSTFTYNPLRDPTVLNALQNSALLYVLFLLAFIFVGGAWVQISRLKPTREFLGMKLNTGSSLAGFMKTVFILIVVAPVIPFLMWLVLMFNYIICNMIMTGMLPSIMLTPENVTLYVAMCFVYALMATSFVWRSLIIGLCMGYCLIIIIMIAVPSTRRLGKGLLSYYILMVFMQPVILAITCVGVGIIQFIAPFGGNNALFGYMVLGLLLLVVSLVFILGPFTIMKLLGSAKNKIKLVL